MNIEVTRKVVRHLIKRLRQDRHTPPTVYRGDMRSGGWYVIKNWEQKEIARLREWLKELDANRKGKRFFKEPKSQPPSLEFEKKQFRPTLLDEALEVEPIYNDPGQQCGCEDYPCCGH